MAVMIGGAIMEPIVGLLLQHNWSGKMLMGVPVFSVESYSDAFSVLPVFYLLAVFVSYRFIRETYCNSQSNDINTMLVGESY